MRAPHVVADEAKLAIVFTYFLVQACLRAPHVVADEAKLAIVFTYFFLLLLSSSSFFFFSAFYFSPTSGNNSAQLDDICKENIFLGNFYFFTKKADFRARFQNGQRSVTEPGPTPSP